jgi:two-component system cell cycle sensor histidine kinase/response regulator CckA
MNSKDRKSWEDLRRRAEAVLEEKAAQDPELEKEDAYRLIQELRVAQAELEIQNEELLASQSALEISRRHYESLFNGSPVGYVVLDRIGMIRQANETFCQMMDCPVAHVTRRSLRNFVIESERALFDQNFPAFFHKGRRRALEVVLQSDSGGEPIEVRIEATPVTRLKTDGSGSDGLLATISDITTTRSLERRLWESQKLEATGQLAGGIAHDFNNILTVIQATVEVARYDLPEGSPLGQYLTQIEQSGARAAALVRQLMAFAQTDKGQPQVQVLSDTPLLMENMLRRLVPESVGFEWTVEDDLFPIHIDPVKLDQVLTNLVLNARDAVGASGSIRVSFNNHEVTSRESETRPEVIPGDYVAISVCDDGHGMSEEVRNKIYEPFFTTKPQGKGTGLGLSTVYSIVKQNRGFIKVQSKPDNGTTFTVMLPRTWREAEKTGPADRQQDGQGGQERVLLVEDDAMVLVLAKRLLARSGYEVFEFEDSNEALAWFAEHPDQVDLVLTDVVMPGLNGPQLVEAVLEIRADLPYLYMSGYHREEQVMNNDAEAEVLRKPFDAAALLSAVRRSLKV